MTRAAFSHPRRALYFSVLSMLLSAIALPVNALTVAAANSTCDTLNLLAARYSSIHQEPVTFICKASGLLAQGIKGQSVSADIYISASKRWMDFMLEQGLVLPESVSIPWGNTLVVAAPKASPLNITQWEELASGQVQKVLIGDPGTAPFGRYAKQALERTDMWGKVVAKVETRKHITLLADGLAQGDAATVGILFQTNINSSLRPLFRVDSSWHDPIRYYMALTTQSAKREQAERFLAFIRSDEGLRIAAEAGFSVEPR